MTFTRIKKWASLLLASAMLGGVMATIGPAPAMQAAQAAQVETSDTSAQTPALTIEWLSQQFEVPIDVLTQQLNQGYTLPELHDALSEAEATGLALTDILQKNNPAIKEKQDELAEQLQETLQGQTPLDYEALGVPVITDPEEIAEVMEQLPKQRRPART
ncbi:hypothetical protein [Cohnella boryungensis]|uniref:Uncharacterized protein n=1 Tax=Cohnella boryungensis TaxID=768479 RepID=A0ABV8SEM5_9BACL